MAGIRSKAEALDEPLELSAPLARRLAPQLCRKDPKTGESCAWYHGFWQYLRLLGLGTTPAGHADFFFKAFESVKSRRPRVLIAGGADYAMFAYALAACRAHGLQAEFSMIDRCETPLMLSRWYGERESTIVSTMCRDLLDFIEEQAYDVICTQALLGHFSPQQRPGLIANWHRALRPGGFVVTANRLRPGAGETPAVFSDQQVKDFGQLVLRKAQAATYVAALASELAVEAQGYASRQAHWPVQSTEDVRQLFEVAGFRIEHLSCGSMTGQRGAASLDVPTVPGTSTYALLVAIKP
jgi:SAM-dependent methyltransferase